MTWRLEISHRTSYQYESKVLASFNEVRMTPATTQTQQLIACELTMTPEASVFTYTDYFGTTVQCFDVQHPHMSLEILSKSSVETNIPEKGQEFISWNNTESQSFKDEFNEYLIFTELVDSVTDPFDLRNCESPIAAVHVLNESLRQEMTYAPGVTNVKTSASQAWKLKSGVCQDFTHVALSLLRAAQIPARYVSGYLYNGDGIIGETVIGESHSWCEAWVGFWFAFDPTNGNQVLEDHILIARGRDYQDVPPLKGIFLGSSSREVQVEVHLTRLA